MNRMMASIGGVVIAVAVLIGLGSLLLRALAHADEATEQRVEGQNSATEESHGPGTIENNSGGRDDGGQNVALPESHGPGGAR